MPAANTSRDHFDTILVLGTPADDDGNPTATEEQARVTEAVREYERGVAPRLLFTGGPAHNRFVEADVMAAAAAAEGIPPSAIFVENQGREDTIPERVLLRADHEGSRMALGRGGFQRLSFAACGNDLQAHTARVATARSTTVTAGCFRGGGGFSAGNPEDDALPGLCPVDRDLRAVRGKHTMPCSPRRACLRLTLSSDHCPSRYGPVSFVLMRLPVRFSCRFYGGPCFLRLSRPEFRARSAQVQAVCADERSSRPATGTYISIDPLANVKYDNKYDISLGLAYGPHERPARRCSRGQTLVVWI